MHCLFTLICQDNPKTNYKESSVSSIHFSNVFKLCLGCSIMAKIMIILVNIEISFLT